MSLCRLRNAAEGSSVVLGPVTFDFSSFGLLPKLLSGRSSTGVLYFVEQLTPHPRRKPRWGQKGKTKTCCVCCYSLHLGPTRGSNSLLKKISNAPCYNPDRFFKCAKMGYVILHPRRKRDNFMPVKSTPRKKSPSVLRNLFYVSRLPSILLTARRAVTVTVLGYHGVKHLASSVYENA